MGKDIFLLNDTSGGHFGCNKVMETYRFLINKYRMNLIGTASIGDIRNHADKVRKELDKADLIIINGEGTMHHSNENAENILSLCENKRVVLMNSVWDKMFTSHTKIMQQFDLAAVRESSSYGQIIKTVPKEKVRIVPDLIFYNLHTNDSIGYCDSVMKSLRAVLQNSKNYFPLSSGEKAPSLHTYIAWLKSLDLCVTGRFHGVCLAAMYNIPFLALPSNCHKIEGLLKDMGCKDLLLSSMSEINKKTPLAKKRIKRAYQYTTKAKDKIELLFSDIRKIVDEIDREKRIKRNKRPGK